MASQTDTSQYPTAYGYNKSTDLLNTVYNVGGYTSLVGAGLLAGLFKVTPVLKFSPLISVICGLARIIRSQNARAHVKDAEQNDRLNDHLLRGIGEILQLGPIFLICDIISTILNCCKKPEPQVKKPEPQVFIYDQNNPQ